MHRKTSTICLPCASLLILAVLACTQAASTQSTGDVSGELKKWHRVTITFDGPQTSESADPNPFRDYRLVVTFKNGDTEISVPGFYAADGNAAESGADSGNSTWKQRSSSADAASVRSPASAPCVLSPTRASMDVEPRMPL